MDDETREFFDQLLEEVIEDLPPRLQELLQQVPLYVEDFPSKRVRQSLGVRRRDELQGLYTGVPLTERTLDLPPMLSEVIYLFREGILALAINEAGELVEAELKRQMRITLLHELGHHFGLDEQDLSELGYG